MELWMKIAIGAFLALMIVLLLPMAKRMYQESPEAQPGDWTSVLIPIALVVGFVALLMYLV